jgi:hypothetical protein
MIEQSEEQLPMICIRFPFASLLERCTIHRARCRHAPCLDHQRAGSGGPLSRPPFPHTTLCPCKQSSSTSDRFAAQSILEKFDNCCGIALSAVIIPVLRSGQPNTVHPPYDPHLAVHAVGLKGSRNWVCRARRSWHLPVSLLAHQRSESAATGLAAGDERGRALRPRERRQDNVSGRGRKTSP